MTSKNPSDIAQCTSFNAAQWAAFLASPIRVGRMRLGQFVLNIDTQTLYQKRAAGTGSGTMVVVGGGSAALTAGQVGFGNAGGTGITSDASFSYDVPTKVVTVASLESTTTVQWKGGTGFYMRLAGTPSANRVWTFPDVASDTVMLVGAAQSTVNKTFIGTSNVALGFDVSTNNQPVGTFGFEARGANGAGAGAAGLAARVPFRAANSAGTVTQSGGIESGWINATAGSEIGYTAMLGAFAGTVYPVIRAVVPNAVATYKNGLQVQGQVMGTNPILSPFGDGANLGLDFQNVGVGTHNFFGQTNVTYVSDATDPLVPLMALSHRLTAGSPAVGFGGGVLLTVISAAGAESQIGGVLATVSEATPGAVQGVIDIVGFDGVDGPPPAGLRVGPSGAAAARTTGVWVIPGAGSGTGTATLTTYGVANGFLTIYATGAGATTLSTPDGQAMVQVIVGPPRKLRLADVNTDVISMYGGVGSLPLAHQANADGTLADITAKYNLLLAFLQARGDMLP